MKSKIENTRNVLSMKKIIYLDTCQPDYFQGFNGDTIIAFHWMGQTVHEALENLESNAQNECHDGATFEAIARLKKYLGTNKLVIDEKYCEPDENGDTGLIHYFGIVEMESSDD